jgi:Zn-finger nucleic acid-binding protein
MYRASSPVTACPRCQHALEERAVGSEFILACTACGGVWLDVGQAKAVFERRAVEQDLVEGSEAIAFQSRAQPADTGSAALCPVGGEEMILCEAAGIRIDQCAEHGTWFDAHELRRIVDAADAPTALDTALETAKETADKALARTTQWLTKVLWGDKPLPP